MKNVRRLDLERLLRSRSGQSAFVAALVLIVSLAMAVPRIEFAELRATEVDRGKIFLHELIRWGAWGLAAWPITRLARWTLSLRGAGIVFFLIQIPLSGAVGWSSLHLDYVLRENRDPVGGERPPEDGRARDRRPGGAPWRPRPDEAGDERGTRRFGPWPGSEGPTWDSPFWRQRWMYSMLVYWVVLGMGAGMHSFLGMRDKERRASESELRAERLRTELARAQLGSLRNQLNPHFLFNALHSVGGLVRAHEEQAALRTLAAIGELLRSTLDHGGVDEVSLRDELAIAERFLEIERIRLGDRLVTEFEIDEDVHAARVPALVLLPLVENAVRHGIAPLAEGGRVQVKAARAGDSLRIEVFDDGQGFPPVVLEHSGSKHANGRRSIGLENTRQRLSTLYGDEQSFELFNLEGGGACVRITLPYRAGSGAEIAQDPDGGLA